jgi:hypothetical protein
MDFGQDKKISNSEMKKSEPYEMHVMPQKFHQYLAVKSKTSASKILIVVALVIFVLTMLGIGGYFLYLQMNLAPQSSNLNQVAVNNENANVANENLNLENLNTEGNLNLADNENANGNLNEPTNENINADLNVNENQNINVPAGIVPYASSLDSDSDKLTDAEEDLYQTEKRKPDTDGDGFLDGDEVINGYNPKVAGGAKLETSGLVNKYSNPVYNYEILYPTSWLARPEDESLKVVLFMTASEEFIRVSVEDNPNKLDLVNWYLQLSPGSDLNLLEKKTTLKGYDALVSPDKLTYYILDPQARDKVYVINYNIGTLIQVNYLSTFATMINSFNIIKMTP